MQTAKRSQSTVENHNNIASKASFVPRKQLLPPFHEGWRDFELAIVQNRANLCGTEGVAILLT